MVCRRVVCLIVTLAIAGILDARAAFAQSARVTVYHGRGNSGGTSYDLGKGSHDTKLRPDFGTWTLPRGTQLCVDVVNAQPNFYNYTLDVEVDTTKEKMPDLGSLATALKAVMTMTAGDAGPELVSEPRFVEDFFNKFSPLADALDRVQAAIRLSDDPDKGVRFAKDTVARLLTESPNAADLERWANAANPQSVADRRMVAALKAYGETLLNARAALQKTYGPGAQETVRKCEKLGDGRTTVRLKVRKRGDFGSRDEGDAIVTIIAEPKYDRKLLEAFPVAYGAMISDVPTFRVDNSGIIRQSAEFSRQFRAGALVTINLPPSEKVAYGPALGVGVSGDKKLSLNDFYVGVVASYQEYFRVGIAYGSAEVTTGLKDEALVNQPLTSGKRIEDLLAKGQRNAWFILVGIPSLGLKSPF
jgi:hypothetical protein